MRILFIAPHPIRLGAQEKDTLSGIELLRTAGFDVEVRFITPRSSVPRSKPLFLDFKRRMLFFLLKYAWPEGQVRSWSKSIDLSLLSLITQSNFDVLWTESSDLAFLGLFSSKPQISRSHNFDPIHFYQESNSWFIGVLRSSLKLLNLITFESRAELIFSISPRDQNLYRKIIRQDRIALIPLRDLILNTREIEYSMRAPRLNKIAILASTYTVWHNREMLQNLIALDCTDSPDIEIHVFGSKIPIGFDSITPANVIVRGWVEDLSEIYKDFDVFLVPTHSGMGMKSKVFEPLAMGKILISSKRNLSGFDLLHPLEIIEIEQFNAIPDAIKSLKARNLDSMILNNTKAVAMLFDYVKYVSMLSDTLFTLKTTSKNFKNR